MRMIDWVDGWVDGMYRSTTYSYKLANDNHDLLYLVGVATLTQSALIVQLLCQGRTCGWSPRIHDPSISAIILVFDVLMPLKFQSGNLAT